MVCCATGIYIAGRAAHYIRAAACVLARLLSFVARPLQLCVAAHSYLTVRDLLRAAYSSESPEMSYTKASTPTATACDTRTDARTNEKRNARRGAERGGGRGHGTPRYTPRGHGRG